jgi:hypothetical protein
MKKILVSIALAAMALPAFAHHSGPHHGGFHHAPIRHHHHRHWHPHYGWVAPVIIGGAVTYAITRPAPIIVQNPPVVVEQPAVDPVENCTPWRETQQSDGTIVRERSCYSK